MKAFQCSQRHFTKQRKRPTLAAPAGAKRLSSSLFTKYFGVLLLVSLWGSVKNEIVNACIDKRELKLFVATINGKIFTLNIKNGAKMRKY